MSQRWISKRGFRGLWRYGAFHSVVIAFHGVGHRLGTNEQ